MLDDAHCLARYADDGDPQAFASLVERYAGMVFATCLRICGNHSDAEDASQEAFLALAKQADGVRSSLPAWLHAVATRAAMRLRLRRCHVPLGPAAEPAAPAALDEWRLLIPHLDAAIAELPEQLRAVVVMRFIDGRSQDEIAGDLGMSQPTVSRRLAEAVQALRQRLHGLEPAVLAAAIDHSRATPSRGLMGDLGRMALIGRGARSAFHGRRAALKTAVALVLAASGVVIALQLARDQRVAPRGTTAAVTQGDLLSRPVTLTWRQGRFDRAIQFLAEGLYPAMGERMELMPSSAQSEATTTIDIAVAGLPMREVLDLVCAQAGWRWRISGTTVLIDRAGEPRSLANAWSVLHGRVEAGSYSRCYDAAYTLASSGDGDACADLLRELGNPRLDALADEDPAAASAFQLAVLHALGSLSTDLLPWSASSAWHRMLSGRPLAAVATLDDGSVRRAIASAWRRCRMHGLPLTPFLCYLAGEWRVAETGVDLLTIAETPSAIASDLDPSSRFQALALEHIRQAATWALGRLGAQAAIPLLERELHSDPNGPSSSAQIEALGLLDARTVVDLIAGRPLPANEFTQGYEYCTLARLDERALLQRMPATIPNGWWDAFTTHPVAGLLPRMLAVDGTSLAPSRVREAFRQGCARLGDAALAPLRRRLEDPADEVMRDWCRLMLARLGDASAIADVARLAPERIDQPPWSWGSEACLPSLTEATTVTVLRGLDGHAGPAGASSTALAWLAVQRGAVLTQQVISAYPRADQKSRAAIVAFLAARADPDARSFLLDLIGTDEGASMIAWFPHTFSDPRLEGEIARRLPALKRDAGFAAVRSFFWGDCDALTFSRAMDWLQTRDPATFPATIVTGDVNPPRGPVLAPEGVYARQEQLYLRWADENPALQGSIIAWLGAHRILRPAVIAAICDRLAHAVDADVRTAARSGLEGFLRTGAELGDDKLGQRLILSGLTDDREDLRRLDALGVTAKRLLDPTPPPSKPDF